MKCEDLLKALGEYVDGTLDAAICDEFRKHLESCNPCEIVVDNVRQTITLYKAGDPYELPPEFGDKLRRALRERWKKKFPPKAGNLDAPPGSNPMERRPTP